MVHLFKIHEVMTKSSLKRRLLIVMLTSLFAINSFSQDNKLTVSQDPKFEQLLNEKRKINLSISTMEGYKIQIYNGENENAKRELTKFKNEFNFLDATIIFNTPYYKVWVGNFKTKIDAQRHLLEIQKKYTNSIIIKPKNGVN